MTPSALHAQLEEIYAAIQDPLAEVESALRHELDCPEPFVKTLIEQSRLFGGKRVRPALLLLSSRLRGQTRPHHVAYAAVVEMLHHATLMHDDVLDGAEVRRHQPTLNARWGNEGAVLLGDFIFARAFMLCARVDKLEANLLLSQTAQDMCVGELSQIAARRRFDLTEDDYFRIIRMKTASLFSAATRLGALGNASRPGDAERLAEYGMNFGMAFQIVDDYLDLVGSEDEMGKSLGTDLAKGKYTLPILALLPRMPERPRRDLCEYLASPDGVPGKQEEIRKLIKQYEADAYTLGRADAFARRAAEIAHGLDVAGDRNPLAELAEFALARRF